MDRERRKQYPPDWEKISRQFRQSRNFTCEDCRVKQGEQRVSRRTGVVYQVTMHAAHENRHEKHNPQAKLRCLCPTCHGRFDYQQKSREERLKIQRLLHARLLSTRRGRG